MRINIYPRNIYQIRKTLFDKLDSLGIKYTSQQNFFKKLAIFHFESVCVQEEFFKDTETTTWVGKHVSFSVSVSSIFVEEPIFLYNSDPHHLISSFTGTLEGVASQSKAPMKLLVLDIETTTKIKVGNILETLPQCHIRREHVSIDISEDDCDNEFCTATQFLQIEKKIKYSIFKNLWNVVPTFYLCLVSTVQNTIWT